MKRHLLRRGLLHSATTFTASVSTLLLLLAPPVRGDQVEMQNGDHYVGQVLSLGANELVLRSEVLGTVRLPRPRIAGVTFGRGQPGSPAASAAGTRPSPRPTVTGGTNVPSDFSAALRQLAGSSNLVQKVQAQLLTEASPEANDKFTQMLSDLSVGKLTLTDIRSQAKSAADQLRAARKDLGDEGFGMIEGYLDVLDSFLKETEPTGPGVTRVPVPSGKPAGILAPTQP